MMTTRTIWIAVMIATTGLCGQDGAKQAPEAPPNPKTEHHAALKQWAGTWKVTGKMDAMPGVPGMENSRLFISSMRGRLFSISGARRRRMPTFSRISGSAAYCEYM